MINIEILKSSELPIPTVAEQVALAAGFRTVRQQAQELADAIDESVRLLDERKRSLVTAAVTGQLDVSSASERAVEAVVGG